MSQRYFIDNRIACNHDSNTKRQYNGLFVLERNFTRTHIPGYQDTDDNSEYPDPGNELQMLIQNERPN